MSSDHQLGVDLRLRRPAGPASRQVLESMVRDLVGADQSLLAPLLHLVGRPSFLALNPTASSPALRLLSRDQLLRDLEDTYHPRVVARLCAVLDGYLELSAAGGIALSDPPPAAGLELPVSVEPLPLPVGSAAAPVPIPVPDVWDVPSIQAPAAPSPGAAPLGTGPSLSTPVPPAIGSGRLDPADPSPPVEASSPGFEAPRRRLPWLVGAALLGGTLLGLAVQAPPLCRVFGLCAAQAGRGSAPASASSRALSAAEQASRAMRDAPDLPAFERALSELDRELLRLSGDPLSSQQQRQRDALQATARDGHQRLRAERDQAGALTAAMVRLTGLSALPAERQESERAAIRQVLEAIPAASLSRGAALQQLSRLQASPAPAAASPSAPAEPTPTESLQQATPAPEPTPPPAPSRSTSSGGGWSGSGSSTLPARPQAPASLPQDDGNSKAPYREDPLF